MTRAEAIVSRIPHLYGEGPELRRIADVVALQIHGVDEAGNLIRRTHHFDQTFDLADAGRLAELLDIPVEPWQERLGDYRAWVHGLRDAHFRAGSVTREAIALFVRRYLEGFQRAYRVQITAVPRTLAHGAGDARVALDENPVRLRYVAAPTGNLLPLDRFTLENRGLDPTPLHVVLTGLGGSGPEHAPLIANLTTRQAVVFLGTVPPGMRLRLEPARGEGDGEAGGDGGREAPILRARLEGVDVSDRLRFVDAFEPGRAESMVAAEGPPQPLVLARGPNDFWYMPLAHYDVPGLDRALLALAELTMEQGGWDRSRFDQALFVQEAASTLQLAWREAMPATIRLSVPAGVMISRAGGLEDALRARTDLGTALDEALERLAAAGVASEVDLRPRRETQPTSDRLVAVLPKRIREGGPTGADRLPDAEGRFGVTETDGSTFA